MGTPRFGMLETIREYAREHLEDEPDAARPAPGPLPGAGGGGRRRARGPGHAAAARRLGARHREPAGGAVLGRDAAGAHAELLRLAAALGLYWRHHGDIREGRDRLERAIALAPTGDPALARALVGLARIAWCSVTRATARASNRAALEAAEAVGDERTAGRALLGLAIEHVDDRTTRRGDARSSSASLIGRRAGRDDVAADCPDRLLERQRRLGSRRLRDAPAPATRRPAAVAGEAG